MTPGNFSRRDFVRSMSTGLFAVTAAGQLRAAEADNPPLFAFGVFADTQYCDAEPRDARHYRRSVPKLAACVEAYNRIDLAFVIHLGDFIDRDFGSFDALLPIYNQLKAPHYHVLGNHEFAVADDKKDLVPAKLGLKERYYQFCQHGWRFIVLDGNDLSLIARRKGSAQYRQAQAFHAALQKRKAVNAHTWNGAVSTLQLTWLDRQLAQADRANEKVIVFCHFPVFPSNAHNLWNDHEVIGILESHRCVVAYMNGHNHAGNYGVKRGIHYVTVPGMVETADTAAYAVTQVHTDQLQLDGYGRTPSRTLTWTNH